MFPIIYFIIMFCQIISFLDLFLKGDLQLANRLLSSIQSQACITKLIGRKEGLSHVKTYLYSPAAKPHTMLSSDF